MTKSGEMQNYLKKKRKKKKYKQLLKNSWQFLQFILALWIHQNIVPCNLLDLYLNKNGAL